MLFNSTGSRRARSPTVLIPQSCIRTSVTRPTPHRRSTGRGVRNSFSFSGATASKPSGFDISLKIFAAILVGATPTETTSPVSAQHFALQIARRIERRPEQALGAGESINASSSDSGSTTGLKLSNTRRTTREIST